MPIFLAHLGPSGTYGEEAAVLHNPEARLFPLPSHLAVIEAVREGRANEGIVAIENSLNGPVVEVTDDLIHGTGVHVQGEVVVPVVHCLIVAPGEPDIKIIYSHPQALGQCRGFSQKCFPKAELAATLSTVAAVEKMLELPCSSAAIASARAAELYGAEILSRGIQDSKSNETRFFVLALTDHSPTGDDKTSLCFSFGEDKPGQLVSVLEEFSKRGINLARVESRPAKTELGRYVFLVDLAGHREDLLVAEAICAAREKATGIFKILGSYPRYQG